VAFLPSIGYRLAVAGLLAGMHIYSFFLPVFHFKDSKMAGFHKPVYGIEVLILCGFGLFEGAFGWFANPLFWLGLILLACRQFRASGVLGLVTILLALTSVFAKTWWFNEGMGTPIAGFGIGFYVWFSSFVHLAIGSFAFLCVGAVRPTLPPLRPDQPAAEGSNPSRTPI
jgi:hypothetical protein